MVPTTVPEVAIDPNSIRGGEIISGLLALIMKDLGFKAGLAGLLGTTLWTDTVDTAALNLVRYSSSIMCSPGSKLAHCVQRIRGIDPRYPGDIKKILLDSELSSTEKMELLRIKLEAGLKQYKGKKRTLFLKVVLASTVFLIGKSTPIFAYLISSIKELLGDSELENFKEPLIELYYEYNAPLPEELVTEIAEKLGDLL